MSTTPPAPGGPSWQQQPPNAAWQQQPQQPANPAWGQPPADAAWRQPAPPGWAPAGPQPLRPDEERTWAVVGHAVPIVLGGFLTPLVLWLVFRDRGPYVADQTKESLNWQLTLLIANVAVTVLGFLTLGIGFLLLIPIVIAQIVLGIIAAVAAGRGEWYRYPFCLRLVH